MTFTASRHMSGTTDMVTFRYCYGPATIEFDEQRGHALAFWHHLGALIIEDNEDRAKAGYARYCQARIASDAHVPAPWDSLATPARDAWIAAFTE